jgi:2-oxoglutarate dehydrogenase E2 component (dihydrolipoamide succinyltransferase)
MPIELKIPEVGESITEVQIGAWLKKEGDTVAKDEPVVVIESEKTTLELPSPEAGTLTKILQKTGQVVPVGTVVAQLETGIGTAKPASETKAAKAAEPATKPASAPQAEVKTEPAPKAAAKKPVASATPITEPAAAPVVRAAGGDREEEVVPMTMLRRTVARRLVEAQQEMAMLTTFNEMDMSGVQTLRREYQAAFEKRYQIKLGLMSFFVKAVIDALKQVPQLNAEVRGNDIIYRNYFDIGMAISSDRGLVVPVLRNAERMSLAEIESAIAEFGRRAREGLLKPEDLAGGTFTITNGGVFGSLLSTPIINPPQTGILGLHTIQDRPVAREGQVVIRPMMYSALTYDHRIVDGRGAVTFLRRVKETIETPARMLVEV